MLPAFRVVRPSSGAHGPVALPPQHLIQEARPVNERAGQCPLGKCVSLIMSPHAKEGAIQYSASSSDLHGQGEQGGAVWREKGPPHGGPHSPEPTVFAQSSGHGSSQTSFFLFEIFVWSVFSTIWRVFGIYTMPVHTTVFGIIWSVFGIVWSVFGIVWGVFGIVWCISALWCGRCSTVYGPYSTLTFLSTCLLLMRSYLNQDHS